MHEIIGNYVARSCCSTYLLNGGGIYKPNFSISASLSATMRNGRICGDVLMVPMMQKGHLTPLMYVGKKLMERGISLTVLMLDDAEDLMAKYVKEDQESGEGLLHVQVVSNKRSEEDKGIFGEITGFGRSCQPFFETLLAEQGGRGPKCMIADQFMGWTQSWATKLNIARYVALFSPATFGYFMYKYSSLLKEGILDNDEDSSIKLPGAPLLHLSDMTPAARFLPQFITQTGDTFGEAAGILFNTFYELESDPIDAFQAQLAANTTAGKQVPKTLAIGPMLPAEFFSEDPFIGADDESECIQWLNTRPASSVLYIAFGSQAYLSPDEAWELAVGLEASHQSFLWVLRLQHPHGRSEDFNEMEAVTDLLPPGFQDRTKDQGLIYPKFAPQLAILSNPATAGFLSHCGWNSSLESLCRGVPMIGWPMAADQLLCCRLLVDLAKVAVEIKTGLKGHHEVVGRDFVEKSIRRLMTQPEGEEMKEKARVLQRQARQAVSAKGSSHESFELFVKDVQSR